MSTLEAPTVTLRDVARVIGAVPLPADLYAMADGVGVDLVIVTDWQGRPAVVVTEAAALVDAVRARHAERMAAKARALVAEDTARGAEDDVIRDAARRAYDVAYLQALLNNARNPHLVAFEASLIVSTSRDVSKAPTVEAGEQALQRLIDGGIYRAPKRAAWWGS